jgi:choline transport protein
MDDKGLKGPSHTTDSQNSIELANATAVGEKDGTHNDLFDMDRMGKIQVLRVSSSKLSNELFICSSY